MRLEVAGNLYEVSSRLNNGKWRCYHAFMRTTVTLDPDVAAMLREMMREKNLSFKEAINTAIRRGTLSQQPSQKRFKQKTYAMGIRDGIDMTKALNIAANLEDEEILRKMARPAGGATP